MFAEIKSWKIYLKFKSIVGIHFEKNEALDLSFKHNLLKEITAAI